jgi:dTDP-4-amino-4,6-dideoxygalactose transaminase
VPHLFGLAANLDDLLNLKVPIIEDCAQAIGGSYHHKPLGSFGQAAIFSFYATKMITTGEGGMVVSNSKKFIEH